MLPAHRFLEAAETSWALCLSTAPTALPPPRAHPPVLTEACTQTHMGESQIRCWVSGHRRERAGRCHGGGEGADAVQSQAFTQGGLPGGHMDSRADCRGGRSTGRSAAEPRMCGRPPPPSA